jgi:hypothetical protein
MICQIYQNPYNSTYSLWIIKLENSLSLLLYFLYVEELKEETLLCKNAFNELLHR